MTDATVVHMRLGIPKLHYEIFAKVSKEGGYGSPVELVEALVMRWAEDVSAHLVCAEVGSILTGIQVLRE